jgi:hypothetical protein
MPCDGVIIRGSGFFKKGKTLPQDRLRVLRKQGSRSSNRLDLVGSAPDLGIVGSAERHTVSGRAASLDRSPQSLAGLWQRIGRRTSLAGAIMLGAGGMVLPITLSAAVPSRISMPGEEPLHANSLWHDRFLVPAIFPCNRAPYRSPLLMGRAKTILFRFHKADSADSPVHWKSTWVDFFAGRQ